MPTPAARAHTTTPTRRTLARSAVQAGHPAHSSPGPGVKKGCTARPRRPLPRLSLHPSRVLPEPSLAEGCCFHPHVGHFLQPRGGESWSSAVALPLLLGLAWPPFRGMQADAATLSLLRAFDMPEALCDPQAPHCAAGRAPGGSSPASVEGDPPGGRPGPCRPVPGHPASVWTWPWLSAPDAVGLGSEGHRALPSPRGHRVNTAPPTPTLWL